MQPQARDIVKNVGDKISEVKMTSEIFHFGGHVRRNSPTPTMQGTQLKIYYNTTKIIKKSNKKHLFSGIIWRGIHSLDSYFFADKLRHPRGGGRGIHVNCSIWTRSKVITPIQNMSWEQNGIGKHLPINYHIRHVCMYVYLFHSYGTKDRQKVES